MGSKREVYVGLGGLFILYAVLTNRVLTLDVPLVDTNVGFRGIRVCMLGQCESSTDHTGLGTFCFALGLLVVAGLVGAVVMDRVKDDSRFWRLAGTGSLVWLLSVVIWYIDFPGHSVLSFGSGLWAAILGVGLASSACMRTSNNEFGGIERAQSRQVDIDQKLAAFVNSSAEPEATEPSMETPPDEESPAPAEASEVALRFVARELQISDEGVTAILVDGGSRKCLFTDMGQVVARQLPEELGLGAALLLDLVEGQGGRAPIRVLPATTVNYQYLPDGDSDDASENVRRLIRLIRALQPDIGMDEGSKTFVDGSGPALPFQTVAHFWKYDSRYGA